MDDSLCWTIYCDFLLIIENFEWSLIKMGFAK